MAEKILQNAKQFPKEEFSKGEVIKLTWKCYLPTCALFLLTAGCIIGSNKVNLNKQLALGSAYAISDKAYRELKDKLPELIGTNKSDKIKSALVKQKIDEKPPVEENIIRTGKGETLFLDGISGRYFKSDLQSVRKAINDINEVINNEDYASLNDLYYELGLRQIDLGDEVGWNIHNNGKLDVDYTSSEITSLGTVCIVMEYLVGPKFEYSNVN